MSKTSRLRRRIRVPYTYYAWIVVLFEGLCHHKTGLPAAEIPILILIDVQMRSKTSRM